jgi:sodium-dependent phosphate cotransporter
LDSPAKKPWFSVLAGLILLYFFLLGVNMMGGGFKALGSGFANRLIQTTDNPFVGLLIGILVTAIIQSSSTTTSIVVGLVAADMLHVPNAIPIVMGANIGTSVTCVLVSLGHISQREDFRRAYAAATMHDIFNILTVLVLLPIELMTHFLEYSAKSVTSVLQTFVGIGGNVPNPLNYSVKPVVKGVLYLFEKCLGLPGGWAGTITVIVGLAVLLTSLYFLVKVLKGALLPTIERIIDRVLARNAAWAMFFGVIITSIVQSSSVTTSLLVPLAAAGVFPLVQILPMTIGANIGTTVTAILAALAVLEPGNPATVCGLTIALCHLLFNICGMIVFFPVKSIRMIPVRLAEKVAEQVSRKRIWAFIYIILIFFVIPGICILLCRMFG